MAGSAFFKGADKVYGSAFTRFFPWLTKVSAPVGQRSAGGVYAGAEAALLELKLHVDLLAPLCVDHWAGPGLRRMGPSRPYRSTTRSRVWHSISGSSPRTSSHSAALTLEPVQTLVIASGKATLQRGGWCAVSVAAANQQWWPQPLGKLTHNITYHNAGVLTLASRPASADPTATSVVSSWASVKHHDNYGFDRDGPPPARSPAAGASEPAFTKYATPSLKVVYF